MAAEYIPIMIQSLEKKVKILDRIAWLNDQQMDSLSKGMGNPDLFDKCVEEKASCIEQLELLDSGFESLFQHTKEELETNKAAHVDSIQRMQQLIKQITDRSMTIQSQEARNKDLMMQKFSKIKQHAKNLRVNRKATAQYYQSMMKMGVVDPQFLNKKK